MHYNHLELIILIFQVHTDTPKSKDVQIFITPHHKFTVLITLKFPFKLFYENKTKEKKYEYTERDYYL